MLRHIDRISIVARSDNQRGSRPHRKRRRFATQPWPCIRENVLPPKHGHETFYILHQEIGQKRAPRDQTITTASVSCRGRQQDYPGRVYPTYRPPFTHPFRAETSSRAETPSRPLQLTPGAPTPPCSLGPGPLHSRNATTHASLHALG